MFDGKADEGQRRAAQGDGERERREREERER